MAQAAACALSYSADGSAAIAQYIAVNLTGTRDLIEKADTADQHILGILQNNVLANGQTQSVTVVDDGPTKAVAGAAIATTGLPLSVDSSGRVIAGVGVAIVDSGANTKLTFTAIGPGIGYVKSISYVDPGQINAVEYFEDLGGDIVFHLGTGGGGAIDTTADDLKTILGANAAIAALISAVDFAGNDGSGTLTAEPAVAFSGGQNIIGINRETASGAGSEIDIILYGKAV